MNENDMKDSEERNEKESLTLVDDGKRINKQ